MSVHNVPVYLGEPGDESTQIGWASEVDPETGGRTLVLDAPYSEEGAVIGQVWFGEPDPNAPADPSPVEEEPVEPTSGG